MAEGLTDVDICSLALKSIGSKPIQSFTDQSNSAQLLALMYPVTRDAVLKSFRWKFAIKRQGLALTSYQPFQFKQVRLELPTGRWAFALPDDYLAMIETDQDPSPYKIESFVTNTQTNAQQLILLTDNQTIGIRYVSRITNPNLFDPIFILALAARIARDIALPETGDLAKLKSMDELYKEKIAEARFQGSIEDSEDTLLATYFTTDTR